MVRAARGHRQGIASDVELDGLAGRGLRWRQEMSADDTANDSTAEGASAVGWPELAGWYDGLVTCRRGCPAWLTDRSTW